MMLILLLDVKNLIRKILIIILMMMKTAVAIKTLLIIKIMSPRQCHHKTQKKLCSYLEIACNEIKCFFYWQKKLNHKCLVKVQPFSSVKVWCMHDHVKPTVWDFNLDHVILHCGTNDLSSERTASQVARSIKELALSLQDNKISISLLNQGMALAITNPVKYTVV